VLLKFMATWITSWSGVPGGIFAPSLSIGAGVGHDVAQIVAGSNASALTPALIAMGMAAFLAATTQAPLTSFIIVMEMIDGRPMVLSLMAAAMLASLISRLISRPLYGTLSNLMLRPTREHHARQAAAETDTPASAAAGHGSTAPSDPPPAPADRRPLQRSLLEEAEKDDTPPTDGSSPRKD
jgi:H+/Cl- antiporter ClcA